MSERKLTTHERRALHARAFNQVIEVYVDLKRNDGASTLPKGTAKYSRVVVPSTCDFVCDVELTAARALTKKEFQMLMDVYREGRKEEKDIPREILDHIKDKVGQMLLSKHIYPTHAYFRGKAIR